MATSVLDAFAPDLTLPGAAAFSITGGRVIERLRNGEMVPFIGICAVEGSDTGDLRHVLDGALYWDEADLPQSLMAQFENPVGGDGHDGAILAGRIDGFRRYGNRIAFWGFIDPFSPGGVALALALDRQTLRGVSVDLDHVRVIQRRTTEGIIRAFSKARIRGVTVCPFQALIEASITLNVEEDQAMVASAGGILKGRLYSQIDPIESLVASGGSSIPIEPPKSWLQYPTGKVKGIEPLAVTADGRVTGHVSAWGTCHLSFSGRCVPVPHSKLNYAAFRTGSVLTAEGDIVRTGPIIMNTVHPDLRAKASDAQAFYADTGCAVADVVPHEDRFGIYVTGVMRPDATPEQIRNFRASDVSPDWRTVNGNPFECVAMLAVNNSGFKTLVASGAGEYVMPGEIAVAIDENGDPFAMVASGPLLPADYAEITVRGFADDAAIELSTMTDLVRAATRQFGASKIIARWTNDDLIFTPTGADILRRLSQMSTSDCGCGSTGACRCDTADVDAVLDRLAARFGPRHFTAPPKVRIFHLRS